MGQIKSLTPNHTAQPTNQVLFEMYEDLNNLVPVIKHMLRPKIKQFMDDNGGRIQTLFNELAKLNNEFFVIVDGNLQIAEPLLNADGTPVNPNAPQTPKLLPGKSLTEYNEKYQKLMGLPTTIV